MPKPIVHDENRFSRFCYIIEAALEYFISILVSGAYLARITTSLGFSDGLTGILSSFVSLGCLFQLGSIGLFRKIRRAKPVIVSFCIVCQLMFGCMYLIPGMPFGQTLRTGLFLICFCGAHIVSQLISPQKTSWLIGFVDDNARGKFTSTCQIVSLLSGMVYTYIVGMAIDWLEAAGRQRLAFVLGGLTIFGLMLLHTFSLLPVKEKSSTQQAGIVSFTGLLHDKMFIRIVLINVLWAVASHCSTPFYGAYQIKELGFSMTFISILGIIASVVRTIVTPFFGRYADKHSFSRMVIVGFVIVGVSFLVNIFTVPANGKIFYTIHHCLYALAMGSIGTGMANLIYDQVKGDARRDALAISSSLSGVAGFVTTCLMSPVVALIQKNGNRLLGISMYPAQFVSAIAFVLTLLLVLYVYFFVIRAGQKDTPDKN